MDFWDCSSTIRAPGKPQWVDETLASQGIVETEALPERRINIAVRETVHQPLRLYSLKAGRQVQDLVEEAVVAHLQAKGESK